MGGIYHIGLEISGVEWSYGYSEKGSGIFAVEPRKCSLGPFNEQVLLGDSKLRPDDVIRILHRLRLEWNGSDYNVMNHNCVVFSRELLSELLPETKLPEYATTLVDTASFVAGKPKRTRLSNESVFGSAEKELMWKEAELIMRDVEKEGSNNSISYREILHSILPTPAPHTPLETRALCSKSLYRIRSQNISAYMRSNTTRHLALHYR